MTRTDPLTPSYIICPAIWRERGRTGWLREWIRKKASAPAHVNPSSPASIFLLCLRFFKYKMSDEKRVLLSKRIFRCQVSGTNNFHWKRRGSPQFTLWWKHPKFHQGIAIDEHCEKHHVLQFLRNSSVPYLDGKNSKINILKDEEFKMSREVLKSA